jgi:hypothetical protein
MEEDGPNTAPETVTETVPDTAPDTASEPAPAALVQENSVEIEEVEAPNGSSPLGIETAEEEEDAAASAEDIIKNLLSENEILKQENNELRNRIEQLENLHITHPVTKANQSPTQTSRKKSERKSSAADATATATTASETTGAKKVDMSSHLLPDFCLSLSLSPCSPSWISLPRHCERCRLCPLTPFASLNAL